MKWNDLSQVFKVLRLMRYNHWGLSFLNVDAEESSVFKLRLKDEYRIFVITDSIIKVLWYQYLGILEACWVEGSNYFCVIPEYRSLQTGEFETLPLKHSRGFENIEELEKWLLQQPESVIQVGDFIREFQLFNHYGQIYVDCRYSNYVHNGEKIVFIDPLVLVR